MVSKKLMEYRIIYIYMYWVGKIVKISHQP